MHLLWRKHCAFLLLTFSYIDCSRFKKVDYGNLFVFTIKLAGMLPFSGKCNGQLHYRLNFDPDKTQEVFIHSLKKHVKIGKIAKLGREML